MNIYYEKSLPAKRNVIPGQYPVILLIIFGDYTNWQLSHRSSEKELVFVGRAHVSWKRSTALNSLSPRLQKMAAMAGYSSISRFSYAYSKIFGGAPTSAHPKV